MRFCFHHGDRPIKGYTILRGVGRGGFSEVYFAVSDGGREVALKAIFEAPEVERRGVDGCLNANHPNLVSIHDLVVAEDGTLFVIMEYLAGGTLRDLLRQNPAGLPAEECLALFEQIAGGLACLHERGIVHRDLKPENLFYQDGRVKIGDYGLAKSIGRSCRSGNTTCVGTVAYMAPEAGRGSYGPAADIYSLGLVLHELLTGRHPFSGETPAELLLKHLLEKPALEVLPQPFRAVIGRALEKRPEDRFRSVGEMAGALRAPQKPAPRFPESVNAGGERTPRANVRRHPALAAYLVLAALFLGFFFSSLARLALPARPMPPATPIRPPIPAVAELPAERSEDELLDQLRRIGPAPPRAGRAQSPSKR